MPSDHAGCAEEQEHLLNRTDRDSSTSTLYGDDATSVIDRPIRDATREPVTTRKELWSYYLYYNGDCGVGPGSYSQAM